MDNYSLSIVLVLFVFTLLYCFSLCSMLYGLWHTPQFRTEKKHFCTIILAAHNEQNTLSQCLDCLIKQDYPKELYEVIIADDRSTDGTAEIIRKYCSAHANFNSVRIDSDEPYVPKKTALIRGLDRAVGEIIVSTDADCIHYPGWLGAINSHFSKEVGMVVGHTEYVRPQTLFSGIDALDYFSQRILGIGFIGLGSAYTCTASNFAYRRTVFLQNRDDLLKAKVRPAEDNLFLHYVHVKSSYKITAAFEPESIVTTYGARDIKHFLNQRFRWGAYGGNIVTRGVKLFFIPVLSYYAILWVTLISGMFKPPLLVMFTLSFVLKTLIDILVMIKATSLYKCAYLLKYFLPVSIIHICLIPLIVLKGNLFSFTWKGIPYNVKNRIPKR